MIRTIVPATLAIALATSAAIAQDAPPPGPPTAPPTATATLTLTLESSGDIERTTSVYQCDTGEVLSVQYVNASPNFLAIVPVEGQNHVFATTISASGARYISGPFEWWSTGGEATLSDLTQGEGAEPLATCTQSSNTP